MTMKMRRGFFLATTARLGLHGRLPKDDEGHAIEVGPGFSQAADKMSGDDNRTDGDAPPKVTATQEIPDDEGDDGEDGGQGDDDEGSDGDADNKEKNKKRAKEGFKELKRERRELRQQLAEERRKNAGFEQRLAAIENGGLRGGTSGDNSPTAQEKAPDPNDAAKYPLGVLDDAYQADAIDFRVKQGIREALDGERQAQKASADNASAEARMAELRTKADELADKGADLHEDFDEVVLEAGLRGDWLLTETTFTAAADAEHGAQILYDLANDKTEAKRVAGLSAYQQLKYIQEKDAEISKTAKPRVKSNATPPPSAAPAGRSSSRTIRADTDNLQDFKKLWYADQ